MKEDRSVFDKFGGFGKSSPIDIADTDDLGYSYATLGETPTSLECMIFTFTYMNHYNQVQSYNIEK